MCKMQMPCPSDQAEHHRVRGVAILFQLKYCRGNQLPAAWESEKSEVILKGTRLAKTDGLFQESRPHPQSCFGVVMLRQSAQSTAKLKTAWNASDCRWTAVHVNMQAALHAMLQASLRRLASRLQTKMTMR